MNYRHAYHAGNFADVFKHVMWMLLIERLHSKDKPFTLLDTHAGIGMYDLSSEAADKTQEYRNGILRLLEKPALNADLARFRRLILKLSESEGRSLTRYPGSPYIARSLLREQDRLQLVELHPADNQVLENEFLGDKQVHVHHMDAYQALKALLPPTPRRGMVLIDPPFEAANEFERLIEGIRQAQKRWATGCFAIWYPIKSRTPINKFLHQLSQLHTAPVLNLELLIRPLDDEHLHGNGMAIINPPWQLDQHAKPALQQLAGILGEESQGSYKLQWLVTEQQINDLKQAKSE